MNEERAIMESYRFLVSVGWKLPTLVFTTNIAGRLCLKGLDYDPHK